MRVTEHVSLVNLPFDLVLRTGERLRRSVHSHVVHGERAVIIDAGTAGSSEAIMALVHEACGDERIPIALLLTHTHPDHIGSAKPLRDRFGIPVYCPASEISWVEDIKVQERDRPVPGFSRLVEGSVAVDKPIEDDFAIDLGGVTLRAIPTPGHSHGSTSYEVLEDAAIISGDAVPLLSEPPIYDDAIASLASVNHLRRLIPECLLPSWHEPLIGEDVERHLVDGERVILRFHEAVAHIVGSDPGLDDATACAMVLSELGFPSINPLALRTFRAHRRALGLLAKG